MRQPRPRASIELLELLEGLRNQALAGQITGFAFAATLTLDEAETGWHVPSDQSPLVLIGELERIKYRLNLLMDETLRG